MSFCEECGSEMLREDVEYCSECGESFCSSCIDEHELEDHNQHCYSCKKKLEIDPPCPICHHEFCEGCISTHVGLCRADEDIHLGIQPTLYAFVFEDGKL